MLLLQSRNLTKATFCSYLKTLTLLKVNKCFFGWSDISANFLGIQNNLKIRGSVCVSWLRSSANKVQPNLFCSCLTSFAL